MVDDGKNCACSFGIAAFIPVNSVVCISCAFAEILFCFIRYFVFGFL